MQAHVKTSYFQKNVYCLKQLVAQFWRKKSVTNFKKHFMAKRMKDDKIIPLNSVYFCSGICFFLKHADHSGLSN